MIILNELFLIKFNNRKTMDSELKPPSSAAPINQHISEITFCDNQIEGDEQQENMQELSSLQRRGVESMTSSVMRVFCENPENKKESIYDRMKKDPRFQKVEEEEIQKIQEQIYSLLAITDHDTGKLRLANLKDEKDLKELCTTRNVFVRKSGSEGQLPSDPKTGYISLRYETLPEDFQRVIQEAGLLPIVPAILKDEMETHKNSVDDIILWFPLINIPVYTSNLIMLLTGESVFPISDSFSIFRLYITIIRFLGSVDFTKSRKITAINWLGNLFQSKKLKRKHLVKFVKNAILRDDKELLASPNDLLIAFDEKRLNLQDILRLKDYLQDVKKYDCGWSNNRIFREDIIEETMNDKRGLCEQLYNKINGIDSQNIQDWYNKMIDIIYFFTFKYLHCYEICIMRLFEDASIKPTIPQKHRTDLATKSNIPLIEHINSELETLLIKHRKEITTIRNETLTKTMDSDTMAIIHEQGMPTLSEINSFISFLMYYAETEEDFRIDITNAKKWIEKKNESQFQLKIEQGQEKKLIEDEKLNDDDGENKLCVICLDDKKNCMIKDCGHYILCISCSNKLLESNDKKCPICNIPIVSGIQRIFDS